MLRWPGLVLALLAVTSTVRADPSEARYSASPERLFWFSVITDSHIDSGDRAMENLAWAAGSDASKGDAMGVVGPQFLFNCGDLTDATTVLVPDGQHDSEWQKYRDLLVAAGMSTDQYIDLPGNHDQYLDAPMDHYRGYSIQGVGDGKTQHNVSWTAPFGGAYQFLAAATPGNDGALWIDNSGIDSGELLFLQQAVDYDQAATLRFAFGHHPIDELKYGKEDLLSLLKQARFLVYFFGHTHKYDTFWRDGTLHVNLDSLGKADNNNYVLVAVDHDSLALRPFNAGSWPMVLITAPIDAGLGGGNPYAYKVPQSWSEAPVRALVFSNQAASAVEYQVDSGTWTAMAPVSGPIWQGAMDATVLAAGRHVLRVRAQPWPSAYHEIAFDIDPAAPIPDPDPVDGGVSDDGIPDAGAPDQDPSDEIVEAWIETDSGGSPEVEAGDAWVPADSPGVAEVSVADDSQGSVDDPDVLADFTALGSDSTINSGPGGARSGGCAAGPGTRGPAVMGLLLVLVWAACRPHRRRAR